MLAVDLAGVPPPPLREWIKSRPGRGSFFDLGHTSALERWMYAALATAERIVRAVKTSTDLPAGSEKLRWRLHLIKDDETMNAFVLPNGELPSRRNSTTHPPDALWHALSLRRSLAGRVRSHIPLHRGDGERPIRPARSKRQRAVVGQEHRVQVLVRVEVSDG